MKILYKIGLISIFLLWAVYFVTAIVLIVPGSIMRLFGVKFLSSYSSFCIGKLKGLKIDLQGWYIRNAPRDKNIMFDGKDVAFHGKDVRF